MTTEFVLHLDKKRAEHLKREARKRGATRNAVVRQALDKLLGEPPSRVATRNGTDRRKGKLGAKKTANGVGWAEHFEWLKKHGRKIDWKDVEKFEELENNRNFR